jgi:glycerate kinase
MKIIIALDSFKGVLDAKTACETVVCELRKISPGWSVEAKPMADGGEGTVAAMIAACNGESRTQTVTSPLPVRTVDAAFGWLPAQHTAVIEMAAASGLPLLHKHEQNPMHTTTRGTGELVLAALKENPKEILLTLGGSATVDGGTGAATALGWQFLDKHGKPVELGGQGLNKIHRIVHPEPTASLPPVKALCDVDNPLCGPRGAVAVYGPQKGATPEMVPVLEDGLANLAQCVERDLGKQILELPSAGAAGGFGAGAVAFFNAELVSGIETVLEVYEFEQKLADADWVITGEGRFDIQSLYGKVVSGVRDCARKTNTCIGVFAGCTTLKEEEWKKEGVEFVVTTSQHADFDDVKKNGLEYTRKAAQELALSIETGARSPLR